MMAHKKAELVYMQYASSLLTVSDCVRPIISLRYAQSLALLYRAQKMTGFVQRPPPPYSTFLTNHTWAHTERQSEVRNLGSIAARIKIISKQKNATLRIIVNSRQQQIP